MLALKNAGNEVSFDDGDTLGDDMASVTYLNADDILSLHTSLVEHFATTHDPIDPPGVKDAGLLSSATMRPQTSLGREEKYKTLETKAAALFHSLVKNHAFHNGNKRTALVAVLAFLDRNGRRVKSEVTDDEVFDMVVGVADDKFPEEGMKTDDVVAHLATWLDQRIQSKRARASSMKTKEFLDSCKNAGCRVKSDGMGWLVQGPSGFEKIPKALRELDGGVIRIKLQNLGLSEASSGISVDEFQEGLSAEKAILHRFHSVLKRLAHA